ncbi:MAG: HK97 family phage prohead protease [Hyphomicrobiaceae bacterium]|nr:MAG: HK97 family phage prohead protease [Hyphomicrobiaceae bacterium]
MAKKLTGQEYKRFTAPFALKEVTEEGATGQFAGEFSGYAAASLNLDRAGDVIMPGAFARDLAHLQKEGVVCWQHDTDHPIGIPLEVKEDEAGLFTRSRISNTEKGQEAMTLIRDGVIRKLSIGYQVLDYRYCARESAAAALQEAKVSKAKIDQIIADYDENDLDEVCLLYRIRVWEYSPVTIPANPAASITAAKALAFGDHSAAVVAAIEELSERVKAIHTLRAAKGNTANPAHLNLCNAIASSMEQMGSSLRQLVAEMGGQPEPEKAIHELNRIWARAMRAA